MFFRHFQSLLLDVLQGGFLALFRSGESGNPSRFQLSPLGKAVILTD
jgi:hypothetical protein